MSKKRKSPAIGVTLPRPVHDWILSRTKGGMIPVSNVVRDIVIAVMEREGEQGYRPISAQCRAGVELTPKPESRGSARAGIRKTRV